jgi:hypothetical protein
LIQFIILSTSKVSHHFFIFSCLFQLHNIYLIRSYPRIVEIKYYIYIHVQNEKPLNMKYTEKNKLQYFEKHNEVFLLLQRLFRKDKHEHVRHILILWLVWSILYNFVLVLLNPVFDLGHHPIQKRSMIEKEKRMTTSEYLGLSLWIRGSSVVVLIISGSSEQHITWSENSDSLIMLWHSMQNLFGFSSN